MYRRKHQITIMYFGKAFLFYSGCECTMPLSSWRNILCRTSATALMQHYQPNRKKRKNAAAIFCDRCVKTIWLQSVRAQTYCMCDTDKTVPCLFFWLWAYWLFLLALAGMNLLPSRSVCKNWLKTQLFALPMYQNCRKSKFRYHVFGSTNLT